MKKIILMMMALCAMTFVGCSKEEGNGGGSLVVDGVNLVGMWTDDNGPGEGLCDYLMVFKDLSFQAYYISDANWDNWDSGSPHGYTFKDGYLYGCTMADFEPDEDEHYTAEVIDGKLIIAGIMHNIKVINNDTIIFYYPDGDSEKWMRIKGFK